MYPMDATEILKLTRSRVVDPPPKKQFRRNMEVLKLIYAWVASLTSFAWKLSIGSLMALRLMLLSAIYCAWNVRRMHHGTIMFRRWLKNDTERDAVAWHTSCPCKTRKVNCLFSSYGMMACSERTIEGNLSSLQPPYSLFHDRIKEICASSTRCEVYSANENLQVPLPRKLWQCKYSSAFFIFYITFCIHRHRNWLYTAASVTFLFSYF